MHVTTTPSEKSTLVVEVELPVDQVARGRRRRHPPPQPAHPRRRVPTRQGPARHARARPRRGRGLGRGRRDARRHQLPRVGREHGRRSRDRDHRPARRRARRGGGGQAAPLQGDRPGPPRGEAGRLRELPVQARDRHRRRRQGRSRRGRAARPAGDARARSRIAPAAKGDWAVIGFVGTRDGVPFDGGTLGADAARDRRGAPHPGLRGAPRRPAARRDGRVRHHVPGRLPGGVAAGRPGPLQRRAQGAPREAPAGGRRRLRRVDGRLRRPGDAPLGDPHAPGAQRPGPGPPRLRRPDHRLRGEERDGRPARHPRRRGGRGDARRAARRAGPPGDHRGGLPLGHRQDAPRSSTPSSGRGPRSGPRRCSSSARSPSREGIDVPDRDIIDEIIRAKARYADQPEARRLLRHAARPGRDPQLAAPLAGRRDAHRPLAGGPSGAPGDPARRGRRPSAVAGAAPEPVDAEAVDAEASPA